MTVDLTASQAVANGVAFLDYAVPDWRDRVNLETFDISDPDSCVLGQVFDGLEIEGLPSQNSGTPYMRGTWMLGDFVDEMDDDDYEGTWQYGFERDMWNYEYDELQKLWEQELAKA